MSDPKTLTEACSTPGLGMRLTISMLKKKFSNVRNISTDVLSAWMNESDTQASKPEGKLLLLDCRDEPEYDISRIPGAIRVNDGDNAVDIVKSIDDLKADDRGKINVVCYCSVGYRSSNVAQKLEVYYNSQHGQEHGRVTFANLEGSLFKWANEKRPMVDMNNQSTTFAHPYNAVFGKLLESEHRKYPN